MMTATITKLPRAKYAGRPPKAARTAARKPDRNALATGAVAGVALILTALSLTHLTVGVERVTGGGPVESAAMATGVDLGFVALEIAQISRLPEATARIVRRYAQPAILGTLAASAALNAFGFASNAQGPMVYPAVAMGCAIPALIYCLTRVAVAMAR